MISESTTSLQPLSGEEGYYFLLTCILVIVSGNSFLTVFMLYFCVRKEVNSYFLKHLGRGQQLRFRSMDQLLHDKISKQITHASRAGLVEVLMAKNTTETKKE